MIMQGIIIGHRGYGDHSKIGPVELGKLARNATEMELKHDYHTLVPAKRLYSLV